jgi:hypothetical protein
MIGANNSLGVHDTSGRRQNPVADNSRRLAPLPTDDKMAATRHFDKSGWIKWLRVVDDTATNSTTTIFQS